MAAEHGRTAPRAGRTVVHSANASTTDPRGPLPLPDPDGSPRHARRLARGRDRAVGRAGARRISPCDLAGARGWERAAPPGDAGSPARHPSPVLARRDDAGLRVRPPPDRGGGAGRPQGPRGRHAGAPPAARGRRGTPADRPAAGRRRLRVVAGRPLARRAQHLVRGHPGRRPEGAPEARAAQARRDAALRLPLLRPAPEHAQRARLHRRQGEPPVAGGCRDRRPRGGSPTGPPRTRTRRGRPTAPGSRTSRREAATTTSTGSTTCSSSRWRRGGSPA